MTSITGRRLLVAGAGIGLGAGIAFALTGVGSNTAFGNQGGPRYFSDLVTIPRSNSTATGRIDVAFADTLDEATVTLSFAGLASPVVGASLHASDPRGDVGPAVVDLFGPGCVVQPGASGTITCALTAAQLHPCAACGLDGAALTTLEDLAFAMEAGLVSVNVRSSTRPEAASLQGAELYGDLSLTIRWHYSGCQTKKVGGGTIHLAPCTTAEVRPFKKVEEWDAWEEDWDWDSEDPGPGFDAP